MDLKREAARRALDYVQDGMVLGLGTGSTTAHFIELLGEALRAGRVRDLVGVPTSESTVARARAAGIPLTSLAAHPHLDLAVDGADEIDPDLNLIKGLGQALLREKIVETQSARLVIIADESKLVSQLGAGPLPVEVARFGHEVQVRWLEALSGRAELWCREDGSAIVTDNGNYLVRCWFEGGIADAYALAGRLAHRAGIVEHGLFLDMADVAVVTGAGGTRTLERGR
ncbi:MAG: ribose-5-phosphate isomerase RpiA [Anaerolineae bacterium]|jgi:ribose 5-phosphate isomerase A